MSSHKGKQKIVERGNWANRLEFVLSCIGLSVGIGNVWRYPYVAYENGGGTFQIPYVCLLIVCGIPLYFMEIIRGQFSQRGPIAVWKSCPAGIGIGWAMLVVAVIGSTYYNVLLAYALIYIASSFTSSLPWEKCSEWWGADDKCYIRTMASLNSCKDEMNATCIAVNGTQNETATKQFWKNYILNIDSADGISDLGNLQWKVVLALAVTWFFIFLCVFKGIKSVGKAVYFTATFPYVILLALLIQGLLLDGAIDGIIFFFTPDWNKLLEVKVWLAAAQQMVYSLSLANGALITLASYNKFNNRCHVDAIHVACLDFLTSFIASVVIFSVIGSLATDLGVPMNSVFDGGQGLAFIIFPEVVTRLPIPQMWSFFFFFMLFMLGVDSTFAVFEAVWSAVFDQSPWLRNHQTKLYLVSIIGYFLSGLIYSTAGGQYVLNLVDGYNTMARTLLVACEVVVVMWIYGTNRFCNDVKRMLGFIPNLYFRISWQFICPIVIIVLTLVSWINFVPPKYGSYRYPIWAHVLGYCIAALAIIQLPFWGCVVTYQHWKKGNWRTAFQPTADWGPNEIEVESEDESIEETKL